MAKKKTDAPPASQPADAPPPDSTPPDAPPPDSSPTAAADGTTTEATLDASATVAAAHAASEPTDDFEPPMGDEIELARGASALDEATFAHVQACGICRPDVPCIDAWLLAGYHRDGYYARFGARGVDGQPLEPDDAPPAPTLSLVPPVAGRLIRCTVVGCNVRTTARLFMEGEVAIFSAHDVLTSDGHLVPTDDQS